MGLPVSVLARGDEVWSNTTEKAVGALYDELRTVDRLLSPYRDDSAVSRLNRGGRRHHRSRRGLVLVPDQYQPYERLTRRGGAAGYRHHRTLIGRRRREGHRGQRCVGRHSLRTGPGEGDDSRIADRIGDRDHGTIVGGPGPRDQCIRAAPAGARGGFRQSAHIDTVSGATFTSDGYRRSLQSALDAAHFHNSAH